MINNILASLTFFSVDDNPELCMSMESCGKKNLFVPLIASFSTLIAILLISLGFWILRRRQKGSIKFCTIIE